MSQLNANETTEPMGTAVKSDDVIKDIAAAAVELCLGVELAVRPELTLDDLRPVIITVDRGAVTIAFPDKVFSASAIDVIGRVVKDTLRESECAAVVQLTGDPRVPQPSLSPRQVPRGSRPTVPSS